MNSYDVCISCGQSICGDELVLPWKECDNPSAFVHCSHCGIENYCDGYGEEDN